MHGYYIQELGITRDEFNKTREKLSEEFGFVASVNDTVWRLLNSINTPDKKPQKRKLIYLVMEHILLSEGKDAKHIRSEINKIDFQTSLKANKSELLSLKASGIRKVKIYTCNDEHVCSTCKALSRKVFDIDEALREMPIPNKCENDQCRCWYNPHFD